MAHRKRPGQAWDSGCWSLLFIGVTVLAGTAGGTRLLDAEILSEEDFSASPPASLALPSNANACGTAVLPGENAACVDDLAGLNQGLGEGVLVLTGEHAGQQGWAWVTTPVDYASSRVRVAFDLRMSGSASAPSDGTSLVFQLGTDLGAHSPPGASLGTGGLPVPSISVAFDLWDDGDFDPESLCDESFAKRTCHAEVNLGTDPAQEASLATTIDVPSFLEASLDPAALHVEVILNGRELICTLQSALGGYGTHTLFHLLLPEAPQGLGLVGFAASTRSSGARQTIDNLLVETEPILEPRIIWEAPLESGGINCGGSAIPWETEDGPLTILGERPYGSTLEITPVTPTEFLLASAGRMAIRDDRVASYDTAIQGLPAPPLAELFLTEALGTEAVEYRARVVPGRYEVRILGAENRKSGIVLSEVPDRRMDVSISGHDALLSFSPAEAAAEDAGLCGRALAQAYERTFTLDLPDTGEGFGELVVRATDLGGGWPPGDAQLNGFLFRRLGDLTGEALLGNLEDHRAPSPGPLGDFHEFLSLSFDGPFEDGSIDPLSGVATVNPGRFFAAGVVDGRLRLADDTAFLSASSIIFDGAGSLVFDPNATAIRAEFDVFIQNPDARVPAEGFVFALIEGHDPRALGPPGGSLGFGDCGLAGVGVEVDLYQGSATGDASGFNTGGQAHVALVGGGAAAATVDHVQDQTHFDSALDPSEGGPFDWLCPEGHHIEVLWRPEGRMEAWVTPLREGAGTRTQVLDSSVTGFISHEAMVGFFASTGGETSTIEIDDFRLETWTCQIDPEVARISGDRAQFLRLTQDGDAVLPLDGSSSTPGLEGRTLAYRWTIEGPFAAAILEDSCRPTATARFSETGLFEVHLEVDDGLCRWGPEAHDSVLIEVREALTERGFIRADANSDGAVDISDAVGTLNHLFLGAAPLACRRAGDTNDDGSLDISDPVSTLLYLFLGGPPPFPPFGACGPDPTEDGLDCLSSPACGGN